MNMILTPVDLSDTTKRVVEEAARLAEACQGYVVLMHVAPARRPTESPADRQLDKIKARLRQRGVPTQTLRRTGEPKREIVDEAEKLAADYVVMGAHGHSALHDLVLGGTTSAVIKHTTRPVVVVPVSKGPARSKRAKARGGKVRRAARAGGTT